MAKSDGETPNLTLSEALDAIQRYPQEAVYYVTAGLRLPDNETVTIQDAEWTSQRLFLQAINMNPKLCRPYNALATCLKSDQDSIKLLNGLECTRLDLYKRCIHNNPTYFRPYVNIADKISTDCRITLMDGRNFSRQELYIKAIELCPKDALALHGLAETLAPGQSATLANGLQVNRRKLLLKAIQLECDDAFWYYVLGCYLNLGDKIRLHDGSIQTRINLFIKSIDMKVDPKPLNNLALSLQPDEIVIVCGKAMDRRDLLVKALALDPQYARALGNLADFLTEKESIVLEDGVTYNKRALLVKLLTIQPTAKRFYELAFNLDSSETVIFNTYEQPVSARQLFIECLSLDPTFAYAWVCLGIGMSNTDIVRLRDGTIANRKDTFAKAIQLAAPLPIAYFNLAFLLMPNERYNLGPGIDVSQIDLLDAAAKLFPNCLQQLQTEHKTLLLKGWFEIQKRNEEVRYSYYWY